MLSRVRVLLPRKPDNQDETGCMARLATLARTLRGLPWLLAGGLTIPLKLGSFYRTHSDIDVIFPMEDFTRIDAAMRRAGYYLSTYFPMSLFGAFRFAISVEVSVDGWLVRHRPRKLKYRSMSGDSERGAELHSMDACPYRIVDGRFVTCDGRFSFPLDRPLAGHRVTTSDGDEIACLDLHFVAAIKQRYDDPKHALDLSVVARHFPGHVGAEGD
jgi:hypothetical protein